MLTRLKSSSASFGYRPLRILSIIPKRGYEHPASNDVICVHEVANKYAIRLHVAYYMMTDHD